MSREIKRISYNNWIHSQLSVAKYYWSIEINGDTYEFDREIIKQMNKDNDDNKLYKPDLVLYK